MIERKFVAEKTREVEIESFVRGKIGNTYCSRFEIKRTPLGEKIVVHTSKPGLIVGKKGENVRLLTSELKGRFKMENPEIEIIEITNPDLDARTVADQIKVVLERFGPKRFKSIGYKTLQRVIDAGAMGSEIILSGRGLPSSRAKSWRFYAGYVKKSGDIALTKVQHAFTKANLRSGTIGIKVTIMPPGTILPDRLQLLPEESAKALLEEQKEEQEKKKGNRLPDRTRINRKTKNEKQKKAKKSKAQKEPSQEQEKKQRFTKQQEPAPKADSPPPKNESQNESQTQAPNSEEENTRKR